MFKSLIITLAVLSLVACDNSKPHGERAIAAPSANNQSKDTKDTNSVAAVPPGTIPRPGTTKPEDDLIVSPETVVPEKSGNDRERSSQAETEIPKTETATGEIKPPAPEFGPAKVKVANATPKPSDPNLCAEPYRETRPEWAPGLPAAPAEKPIFTDASTADAATRFTDARRDDMFAVALERANALPNEIKEASLQFAKQIRDVRVLIDMIHTKEVKVHVLYQYRMSKEAVELRGVMEKPLTVGLAHVPKAGAAKDAPTFGGVLTCTDADRGCKNVLLRLDVKSKNGKITRSAYIVHRWGEAHVKMSDMDRRQFAKVPNQNQSAFLEYVSNSLNNQCLATLAEAKAGRRELPLCAQQRLEAECGTEDAKKPAARAFGLRSWAVANGRAAFEMVMSERDYDGVAETDIKQPAYLTVRGALVHSKSTPVNSRPLIVNGSAKGLSDVYLMNNDGAGNLNFRFDFGTGQDEKSRLSVSSLLPNSAYSQSVVQAAQTSPSVPQSDVEQQESVSGE